MSFFKELNNTYQAARGLAWTFLTEKHVPGDHLRGKWIVISGSNNGVGLEAAKSFAEWGANLVLGCREDIPEWEVHPASAVKECKALAQARGYSSTIEWWELDMADLSSVEAFCQKWLDTGRALDILCNNAGVSAGSNIRMTKDGFQWAHQINFLSHVLLTLRLLPCLARSAEPRIVCTTSSYHHLGKLDLEHFNGGSDQVGVDYSNNKLYFQIWVAEMQSRFLKHPEYIHITINGVHPGFVASGIWNTVEDDVTGRYSKFLLGYIGISSQQGSLAITHAATSPECGPDPKTQGVGAPNGRGGGRYFNRIWEAPASPECHDPEARLKVWLKVDEELGLRDKGLLEVLAL